MRVDVVTLFPEEFGKTLGYGVVGRAIDRRVLELRCWNPRDFASDERGTVDDRPFGGGPGMVLATEPLRQCLAAIRSDGGTATTALLAPDGKRFDQEAARIMSQRDRLVLVCGRYEGIDERLVAAEMDEAWSVGDYVLSGGELPAAIVVDAVARLLPGVLGKAASAVEDSFFDGLLDCPHYTRPEHGDFGDVPPVLLSGHHEQVRRWRLKQSLGRTWQRRPDLLRRRRMSKEERELLAQFIEEYMAGQTGRADEEAR
ncbi:MAG: tRNA (guanosine(37)-N1)-methyltransferase TrmD [Pseudomonadota bacterium]